MVQPNRRKMKKQSKKKTPFRIIMVLSIESMQKILKICLRADIKSFISYASYALKHKLQPSILRPYTTNFD